MNLKVKERTSLQYFQQSSYCYGVCKIDSDLGMIGHAVGKTDYDAAVAVGTTDCDVAAAVGMTDRDAAVGKTDCDAAVVVGYSCYMILCLCFSCCVSHRHHHLSYHPDHAPRAPTPCYCFGHLLRRDQGQRGSGS